MGYDEISCQVEKPSFCDNAMTECEIRIEYANMFTLHLVLLFIEITI